MRKKVNSSGILIKNNNLFFLVHNTGSPNNKGWGIPKGKVDDGETIIEAAIRETKEECGLTVNKCDLKSLDIIEYNSKDNNEPIRKKLYIYLYNCPDELLNYKFYCSSYFPHRKNKNIMVPEIDNFGWFDKNTSLQICIKSMRQIFELF